MKKTIATLFLLFAWAVSFSQTQVSTRIGQSGLSFMSFGSIDPERNLLNRGAVLGEFKLTCRSGNSCYSFSNVGIPGAFEGENAIIWNGDAPVVVRQSYRPSDGVVDWTLSIENTSGDTIELTDLAVRIPVASTSREYAAQDNFQEHASINGSASYIYWTKLDGRGSCLLMTPLTEHGFEFVSKGGWYYLHSATSVNREDETWSIPSSSVTLLSKESVSYSFRFSTVPGQDMIEDAIFESGGVNVRVVPGMVVARGQEVRFALRTKDVVKSIVADRPQDAVVSEISEGPLGFITADASFGRLGENTLVVDYGNGRRMYLEFFVTEDIETLVKKRSRFITARQQHTDPSKWYNGLYSIYDAKLEKLLSPDDMGDVRESFIVGGSDDPSNAKPVFVSEKNVAFPNAEEIASLEYYEKNFVWGKLQRTGEEYPYPYGIYGSENWHENRSGAVADYNSGGWGKERMWRTFDYVTHIAIYYNLYLIARDNPSLVHYLDADGYLDRAYHTAMAFFEVPYNIYMGERWAFHGWCDWAYKQGNFHERYILDLIAALEENGRSGEAARLRREWEKKVSYMIYEEKWPFGSEMFVDRTAFESSYYVGEYALKSGMTPQEQFWYDKNRKLWYSYKEYPLQPKLDFMENQLRSNLALRGILEPGYYRCGSAWVTDHSLDYMSQMGGVALLDYAVRFAENPEDIVRYGYNSLLSSWALMNTGDRDSAYGYWYPGVENDGAAGWAFSVMQDGRSYGGYLPLHRGAWRIDGEIDHGFTGAVHGAGCYIVDDPVFGEVAYGGSLVCEPDRWSVSLEDGVRRYLAIPQAGHFEMKLLMNGIQSGSEVVLSRDLSEIVFSLEIRSESPVQRISFSGLPQGVYSVMSGKKVISSFSHSDGEVSFRVKDIKGPVRIVRK